ncbi:MAG: helix-turn-helix domain-containing protein [Candidatus Hydrogenedentes bacterium]|nr:helix-turn-helix domain-containing protein [Candidatus Hydrogenedentota bacterium]
MKENNFSGMVLRERREAMGFSIEGARARTHVPAHCLQAFESGVFEQMPEQAYTVGFLRSYCRFLDVEPEAFVDQYLVCTKVKETSRSFRFVKQSEANNKTVQPYPLWINDVITWGAVCAVILLIWLGYSMIVRPFTDDAKEDLIKAGAFEAVPPTPFEDEF